MWYKWREKKIEGDFSFGPLVCSLTTTNVQLIAPIVIK